MLSPRELRPANLRSGSRIPFATAIAWGIAVTFCSRQELPRFRNALLSPAGVFSWFTNWDPDTTFPFLVLISLPALFFLALWSGRTFGRIDAAPTRTGKPTRTELRGFSHSRSSASVARGLVTVGLFFLSFLSSATIGYRDVEVQRVDRASAEPVTMPFFRLPPAYHDEFSYLLQARTFLAARVSWPAMKVRPDLFHQIHVLNEPRTASRYFPLTGLWMAPFVALENPYPGHWFAGALACAFFFRALLRLVPFRWAVFGGLLIAISPGLAVFSNLLLAHHPTLLMLSAFLWGFFRLMETGRVRDAMISGVFLALAMLGRPMTAAGFALPFGVWLLWRIIRSVRTAATTTSASEADGPTFALRLLPSIGIPLVAGFAVLGAMNWQITGEWTRSAYQYYTDTWTPRHRYGFHNVEIGSRMAGPQVLTAYDRWATDLNWPRAIENVGNRMRASAQWTLGIAPLLFLLVPAVLTAFRRETGDVRIRLLMLSIVSLHAAHIPYWYDGIMHWHYVFESAPLLIMLSAVGGWRISEQLYVFLGRRLAVFWLSALLLSGLLPCWKDADSFWGPSRVTVSTSEQRFSRLRFEVFRRLAASDRVRKPSLIMVDESGSDPQLSYIVNPPDLSGDTLVCRKPQNENDILDLQAAFPDRAFYNFDPQTFELNLRELHPVDPHGGKVNM